MALVYRPIIGRFLNIDGTSKHGYIEFTPTIEMVSAGEAILPLHTVSMAVDKDGYISGQLACTDSPDVSPTGWLWSVEEKVENGSIWWMNLPTGDGSPYDIIAAKVPGLVPPSYQIAGTPGPAGPAGPAGPPGPSTTGVIAQPNDPGPPEGLVGTSIIWIDTDDPSGMIGIPSGGLATQALVKASDADHDVTWGAGGGGSVDELQVVLISQVYGG